MKRQDIVVFTTMIEIYVGKRQGLAFLSKKILMMESVYWGVCTKEPGCFQYLVIWSFSNGHSALFVWTNHVLLFPTCANKACSCPIRRLLKVEYVWHSFQKMESNWTKLGVWDQEGAHCFLWLNYRSPAVNKSRVDFLREVTFWLVAVHGFDDTVEQESFQNLVCRVWEMTLVPRLY